MNISTEDGLVVLRLTPAEAKKLVGTLRSPSGHCDWCESFPECTDECVVSGIEMAARGS